ncbi:HAD-IA family hydrolase [Tateyamaria omphalii]|uniref:HAD-IA family hydrolase n=1 Tax=Tateyamaria omphalii TaxID=299262 RepID=UPI001C994BC8|nr:HAD-IA family hydrolase [Tateyamaria omphalii]MBY5934158.1 HAD-IA family hydrolase [Tateyamaria omphalii]
MSYSALLLGSIGVLAETSDMQRRAFNTAFEMNEMDWHWDEEAYRALLEVPGGKARLNYYAKAQSVEVDIDAIYEAKLEVFETVLADGVDLRPGIADLIAEAQTQKMKIGFVTATDPRQVAALLKGLQSTVDPSIFDFIGDRTIAARTKPAPDIYNEALRQLDVTAGDALAIEDMPESAQAAVAAGIRTLAYPGEPARNRSFGDAVEVIDFPHASLLRGAAVAA